MIQTLSLPNFADSDILEELELSADAAPSQAIIAVLNSQNIAANDYLILNPGEETAELRQVASISGNNITLTSNLLLQHRNHERVIKAFGSQIRVYRTPDVDGTPPLKAAFIASGVLGTADIDPDQESSFYTDNAGGSGFWYKFTYYNPTTLSETDIDLAEPIRGGEYGNYVSIEDIRAEAGLGDSRRLGDSQVAARREEAESEIKGKLSAAGYTMPLQTQSGVSYVPAIIENIARLLAAGLVLMQNFGITKPGSAKDGNSKVDTARKMLAEIQLNDTILLDSNEQPLAKALLLSGWPDETTKDDGFNIGPKVTMDKRF